jgi:deoxyribodipyrimidine photo-lyase
MQNLIDGDFASNNGGWQWSASTGTDAAPYFRIFNPVTQSQNFDPEGLFIKSFVPELAHLSPKEIHLPEDDLFTRLDYPKPIVDLKMSRQRAIDIFKNNKQNLDV